MDDTQLFPSIPIGDWVTWIVDDFLLEYFTGFFDVITAILKVLAKGAVWILSIGEVPGAPFILTAIIGLIAWRMINWKGAVLTVLGLLLVNNMGMWVELVDTLALVVLSVIISMII